jgi:hypothetical protein
MNTYGNNLPSNKYSSSTTNDYEEGGCGCSIEAEIQRLQREQQLMLLRQQQLMNTYGNNLPSNKYSSSTTNDYEEGGSGCSIEAEIQRLQREQQLMNSNGNYLPSNNVFPPPPVMIDPIFQSTRRECTSRAARPGQVLLWVWRGNKLGWSLVAPSLFQENDCGAGSNVPKAAAESQSNEDYDLKKEMVAPTCDENNLPKAAPTCDGNNMPKAAPESESNEDYDLKKELVTPACNLSNFNDRLDIDDEEDSLGDWIYKQSRMAKAAVAAGAMTPVPSASRTGVELPHSEYSSETGCCA